MKSKMKKIIFVFTMMFFFCISLSVQAASASISASSSSVYVGDNVVITVRYNAGAWNLQIGGAIADRVVGYDSDGNNVSGSKSWTLDTSRAGTYTVTLGGDVTDAVTDANTPASGSVTVTVSERPVQPEPSNPVNPAPNNPTTPTTPSNPTPAVSPVTAVDERSSNTNLKSLTVTNYQLEKRDEEHYVLVVPHSIDKVSIEAVAEDSKAKVSGTGSVSLKVGDNNFNIVVTAENGATKTYSLLVTRRNSQYDFNDINTALQDSEDVTVLLNDKYVLSESTLEAIQKYKKIVNFVKRDEQDKDLYNWIIDGSKLNQVSELDLSVRFGFDNTDEFDKLVGYRKGIYIHLNHTGKMPKGVTLEIPVGDTFKDSDSVNLYSYDANKSKVKVLEQVNVKNGKITFTAGSLANYFATKALIGESEDNSIYKIVAVVEFFILLILALLFIVFQKKAKKNTNHLNPTQPFNQPINNNQNGV